MCVLVDCNSPEFKCSKTPISYLVWREVVSTCRYQGESDAVPERVEDFKSSTQKVLQSIREALGAPDLPIVQVAVTCNSPKTPLADRINTLQRQMKLPVLATVDATGLELQEDGVHLTTEAQRGLAHSICKALIRLTNGTPPIQGT